MKKEGTGERSTERRALWRHPMRSRRRILAPLVSPILNATLLTPPPSNVTFPLITTAPFLLFRFSLYFEGLIWFLSSPNLCMSLSFLWKLEILGRA